MRSVPELKDILGNMMKMGTDVSQWYKHTPPLEERLRGFAIACAGVERIDNSNVYKFVTAHRIMSAVKIVRTYRGEPASKDAHDFREQGCNIVVFDPMREDRAKLERLLKPTLTAVANHNGFQIWSCQPFKSGVSTKELAQISSLTEHNFRARGDLEGLKKYQATKNSLPREPAKYFFCLAAPGVLLTARADDETIRLVLDRINGAALPAGLPESLPEWKHVRADSDIFAIRHFELAGVQDKTNPRTSSVSTSALNKQEKADPLGEGFVLNFNSKLLEYDYLTKSKELKTIVPRLFPVRAQYGDLSKAEICTTSPGLIQFKIRPGVRECESYLPALYWLGSRVIGTPLM